MRPDREHHVPYLGLAKTVYIHTVHDCKNGNFPAKIPQYTHRIYRVLANPRCISNMTHVLTEYSRTGGGAHLHAQAVLDNRARHRKDGNDYFCQV